MNKRALLYVFKQVHIKQAHFQENRWILDESPDD